MRGIVFVFALLALSISVFAGTLSVCGDQICQLDETCISCSQDCGTCIDQSFNCGNQICSLSENCTSCSLDCGTCPTINGGTCGDQICTLTENCTSCSLDCGTCGASYCGDNICNPLSVPPFYSGENPGNCPRDCNTSVCGDGWCTGTETNSTCPIDCNFLCGDADGDRVVDVSDAVFLVQYVFGGGSAPNPLSAGDADNNDQIDVSDIVYLVQYIFGSGSPPCNPSSTWNPGQYSGWTQQQVLNYMRGYSCGDGACSSEVNETCVTCPQDCGSCCGNGVCEGNLNETCSTCPQDCGICQNCTPSWFCKDGKTKAYRSATCQVTYFSCGTGPFCCKNGQCVKDMTNKCSNTVIYSSTTDQALAQVQGPLEGVNILAAMSMVVLVSVVLYAFVKIETHM
ncbi:MAG: dockerin type I repeat-containing protein [Candidatus Micrarchaeota archaeon]